MDRSNIVLTLPAYMETLLDLIGTYARPGHTLSSAMKDNIMVQIRSAKQGWVGLLGSC